MGRTVRLGGDRNVTATLDQADGEATTAVVACPPHPQHRGHRGDTRLRAVSAALTGRGIDCLRFDYGPWDNGYGECTDADNAVSWAQTRYDRVGIFGFSFGGTAALVTAASRTELCAVSALAPTARLNQDADAVEALGYIDGPVQIVYATRDNTADWEPVVDRARERESSGAKTDLIAIESDHFFIGREHDVAEPIGRFLAARVHEET